MTIISDDAFVRLFQRQCGLSVDGWAGRETIAMLNRLVPVAAAPDAAIPDDYWPMLSRIESSDKIDAKAKTSSASGLYQFIRATWIGEGGEWGGDTSKPFGGLTPLPSAEEQLARAKSFTVKNADYLERNDVPINKASLYAAHFLGAMTAASLIAADTNAAADAIAGAAATKANASILQGKTVGDFLTWLHKKTGEWAR